MLVGVLGAVDHAKFGNDQLRGYNVTEGRISIVPQK